MKCKLNRIVSNDRQINNKGVHPQVEYSELVGCHKHSFRASDFFYLSLNFYNHQLSFFKMIYNFLILKEYKFVANNSGTAENV